MVKKLILNIDYKPEYTIIGISSHLKDYRLSFNINKKLNFKLKKLSDLVIIKGKNKKTQKYSLYHYEQPDTQNIFYLISNNNPNGKLIPSQKQTDYFLLIKDIIDDQRKNMIVKTLKAIRNVLMVYEINPNTIKNIDSILTEVELQGLDIMKKEKYSKKQT
ncbi:MAG: IPExxxVDY family protein [Bacteroidetes bacterium]|nr:IPExxxVDY family protein [Bacteroidota bacterium]MCK4638070.1 IPExxxVDY family protein [Bacteroidales bacterium]